jgi:hypothetical protein
MTQGGAGDVVVLDRPRAPRWRRHVALVLGLVLVVGWLAWAVLTWQAQVRYVTVEDLETDLADGHVTSYLMVSNVRPTRTWPPSGTGDLVDVPAADEQGDPLTRSAVYSLMYFTDHSVGPVRVLDPDRFGVYAEEYAQRLRADGVPSARQTHREPPDNRYQLVGLALGTLALGSVVFAARPGLGTRFFWFWVIGIVGGLGVLAYAVCEPLRQARDSSAVPPESGPGPGEGGRRRLRGWHGFVLAFVLSTVLAAVVGPLGTHLDGILFPHW